MALLRHSHLRLFVVSAGSSQLLISKEFSVLVPTPPGVRYELSVRYRRMICHLLGVHMFQAEEISLLELRVYGRAYNALFQNRPWYYMEIPEQYQFAIGHLLYGHDGTEIHFAQAMQYPFIRIAEERGDVFADGLPNPGGLGYFLHSTKEQQRALGMTDNPLGMPPDLGINPVDTRRQTKPQ